MATYEPDSMITEARRQRLEVEALGARASDVAFASAPEGGGWSAGECLEHLTLMNRIYLDAIDEATRRGRAAGRKVVPDGPPKRHGWLGDAFVRSLAPPATLKTRTFRRTVPARRPRADVLRDFMATQDRLVSTIDGARDLDFSRVRMSSPFFRLLRLSLGQSFGAMLAHNRRHIAQAEAALASLVADAETRS